MKIHKIFQGTYMDRKQPFESLYSFLGVDAFLPIWILFVLNY